VRSPGSSAFHHFNTFHGSGPNTGSVHRRAVISHLIPVGARFHAEHVDPVYSRYRRVDDLSLDESFFPVVWTRDGYRTEWLRRLVDNQHVAVSVT
jgi:2-oxoglutarate-dependent dioxygenase